MMSTLFLKTDDHGESDVILVDGLLSKRYDYNYFESRGKQKLKPYEYILYYQQLHYILSKKPIFIDIQAKDHFIHGDPDRIYTVPFLEQFVYSQKHTITSLRVDILELDPNGVETQIDEGGAKHLITYPTYIEGEPLAHGYSSKAWNISSDYNLPAALKNIPTSFCEQLNIKYGHSGLVFDKSEISLMNFKVVEQEGNRLILKCTDLGGSIGRLIERNRSVIPSLAKKLKVSLPPINKQLLEALKSF